MIVIMSRSYRIALFCCLFPLVVGVSIFVLWLITHWPWLMIAGMVTICGGVGFFVVGMFALAWFCRHEFRTPQMPRRRFWVATIACAGLLLSNFPIALGIIVAVYALETRYTVVVYNTSQRPLENVSVVGGGCDCSLGTIPPGSNASGSVWPKHDGQLELHTVSGTTTHSEIIEGYVTNNMGGQAVVTFNPDGTISVDHPKY
jgi:hypothetical protein